MKTMKPMLRWLPITLTTLLLPLWVVRAQPVSGLYQILSGQFTECCGIAGQPFAHDLPNEAQAFVDLSVDRATMRARMTILGEDSRRIFRIPGFLPFRDGFDFSLSNGQVFADHIQFGDMLMPFFNSSVYTVSNSADSLRINGTVHVSCQGCADVPTTYKHIDTVAVLMPKVRATAGGGELKVCWESVSNRVYQLQYRAAPLSESWHDISPTVVGDGSTQCLTEQLGAETPARFYRVLVLGSAR